MMFNVLFSHQQIKQRIKALAVELKKFLDNAPSIYNQNCLNVTFVPVLEGARVFFNTLFTELSNTYPERDSRLYVTIRYVKLKSYDGTCSTGKPSLMWNISIPTNSLILVVEDIVDTGTTLNFLIEKLMQFQPLDIKVCALLDKPARRKHFVKVDWCCFRLPEDFDKFVVGFGMDYNEMYREESDIMILEK